MENLGIYKITFAGNVTQIKLLINHSDYIDTIKRLENEAYEYEKKNNNIKAKQTKSYIKSLVLGMDFFTTGSPIFKSQSNNNIMILPKDQGVEHFCKIEKL